MRVKTKAILSTRTIGDRIRLTVDTGNNVYSATTDDTGFTHSVDSLLDILLKKEFGFTRHDLLILLVDSYRENGGI